MQNRVSRRWWMLTTAALSVRYVVGDEPKDHVATAPANEFLPLTARSIRLSDRPGFAPVITAIAADPLGEFVAVAGDDHQIRILTAATMQPVQTLRGHRDKIRTMSFSPNGEILLSAGNDGQLLRWERNESFRVSRLLGQVPSLACVRTSPNGKQAAVVGFGNSLYLIDCESSAAENLQCASGDLRAVAFRDDSRLLAVGGRSGELVLFDLPAGVPSRHAIHGGRIHGIAFIEGTNQVVCVADDGYLSIFDTNSRRVLRNTQVAKGKLFAIAVINQKLVAVAGSDNVVRIVNIETGSVTRKLTGHSGSVAALDVGDGLLFSGGYDTTLRRWSISEIETGEQRIAEGDPRIDR